MKNNLDIDNHLSLNARPELLNMISSISDLENIKENILFSMIESVLSKVAIAKYGTTYHVRAKIHRNNGAIFVEKVTTVVEEVEDPSREISLEEAQKINPGYQVGDEITEELPPIDLTRSMMQKSLSALSRNIKELEKSREYDLYKDSIGNLVSGVVKRTEFGNVVVDLGNKAEGFLHKHQSIRNEVINVGDKIRALVVDVKENLKGPQVLLSRTSPNFVIKLFEQEIPEVFDGIVEIKAIAREPGARTKLVVASNNPAVDPVGVCIGYKGVKINGVLDELKHEKVDLIKYSEYFLDLVMNAFWPIKLLKVVADDETEALQVVVDESQLSIVIGRGGQNIRLISKLLKCNVEVMTEAEEKEKRQKSTQEKVQKLIEALDVDEVVAHLLILEGFATVEELASAEIETLTKIEDFNEELAIELISRATEFIKKQQEEINGQLKELKISSDLKEFEELNSKQKLILGKNNVKTLQDVADLSSFELVDIFNDFKPNVSMKQIEHIIMSAREQVAKGEKIKDDNEQ